MIALMVTDPAREDVLVPKLRPTGECTGGTLIVCPVSVMSNWTGQIKHHVGESMPVKTLVYHGQGRESESLSEYDVVVTSYGLSQRLGGTIVTDYHSQVLYRASLIRRRPG